MTRLTLFSTIIAMTLIVAARYLAVSGAFAWLGLRRHPQLHDGLARQIRREIGWSLASAAIYAAPAAAAVWAWQERGWTRIYSDLGAYPLWWLPLSLAVALFIQDSRIYWTHRWMHRPAVFRRVRGRPAKPWIWARIIARSGSRPASIQPRALRRARSRSSCIIATRIAALFGKY